MQEIKKGVSVKCFICNDRIGGKSYYNKENKFYCSDCIDIKINEVV
jgi:predicted  nucleic acid-binding Zn ribbon protein